MREKNREGLEGMKGGDDRGVMEGIRERNTVQPKKDNIIIVIDVIEAK